MDTVSKAKRSEMMSKVRSQGNRTTELRLIALFRKYKIAGWRRNSKLIGHPDFVFPKQKIAVFVDGCFWHGCRICKKSRLPKTHKAYWKNKIEDNRKRDKKVVRELFRLGYKVVRIRECSLKKYPMAQVLRIIRRLEPVLQVSLGQH